MVRVRRLRLQPYTHVWAFAPRGECPEPDEPDQRPVGVIDEVSADGIKRDGPNAAISSSSTDSRSLVFTAVERHRWTRLFERRSRSRHIRYTANMRSRQGSAPSLRSRPTGMLGKWWEW